MVFVAEDEVNYFGHSSGLVRSAVDLENGDGFREFKESEPGAFCVVSVNELSGCPAIDKGVD